MKIDGHDKILTKFLVDTISSEPAKQLAPESAPGDEQAHTEPTVRFKSTIEEIDPKDTSAGPPKAQPWSPLLGDPADVTPEQIRDLSDRLKACPLQERRMNIFSYEAFSLPPSRVRWPPLSHSRRHIKFLHFLHAFLPAYSEF